MSRATSRLQLPLEDKVRVVLAVLAGELTVTEAARRHGVSGKAIRTSRDPVRRVGQGRVGERHAEPRGLPPRRPSGDYERRPSS
jgi:transposase-like protein